MKKAGKILGRIAVWVLVVFAVCMMIFTIVSVATFDRTDRDLFGYKAFIVLSDSMKKTDFESGDLVLIREVDPATLQAGDIIAYTSQNTGNFGETVTHKIRTLTTDAEGNPGFVTYGTATDTDDETIVTYPYVLGKYAMRIPNVGSFFFFLKSTPGYICCIFLPFLLLILLQGVNCIRIFRRYKAEQAERLKQEREALETERQESQKLMQELLALKAELDARQTGEQKDKPREP